MISYIVQDFYCLGQKEGIFKNLYSPEFRAIIEYIPFAWLQEFLPLNQQELSSPCNYYKRRETQMKNQCDCTRKKLQLQQKVI